MKETTKRTRLDLYERIVEIRNRCEKIFKEYWTNTSIWFRNFMNYNELEWISKVEQFMTIKWLRQVIEQYQ